MTQDSSSLSTDAPLRIVAPASLADPISAALEIPAVVTTYGSVNPDEMAALLADADVLIGAHFAAGWVAPGSPLRLIQSPGAGTDGIDFSAVPPGCTVCNMYGHEYGIAEYVFMTMAALNRELFAQDAALRRGEWMNRDFKRELRGRTLLVVGVGHIGAEVVRWGRFLGMGVIGVTRSPSPQRAAELGLAALGGLDELDDFLPEADFVVVAVPLTQETTGLIGERELARMKPTAYLVNVARGPVVEENAFYTALHSRRIAGAAIDVWYQYPQEGQARTLPSRLPFHELDNVILTPHTSGLTEGTMSYRWKAIAENLRRLVQGEPLLNVVWTQPRTPQ